MTTFNTGNPIGSTAVKDLHDNAENLDHAINDRSTRAWKDRLGVERRTWHGMEQDFQDFLLNSGYESLGDYGPDIEITKRNQFVWKDGELYRVGGSVALPYTTTGDWLAESGNFVAIGDRILRDQLASTAEPDLGAAMIGFVQPSVGAISRTQQDKSMERVTAEDFGAVGDGVADDTAMIQAALNAVSTVYLDGTYKITDELLLNSNQTVMMTARTEIRQHTANKSIFRATQKTNVWLHCSGAVLYGEGSWSASWAGNGGHEDRAIQFIGCENCGVTNPTIRNCASAGIAVIGGSGFRIIAPRIEGTHSYSTPIPAGSNFQNGIYIADDATYGLADDILIIAPDISGVAMGILRENYGTASLLDVSLTIVGPNIHNIPGQHAFYIQGGKTAVSNPTLSQINLSGFKVQSADANQHIKGFTCTGVSASNVKSNLFEIATIGSGSISDVSLSAVGDFCGTGIAINGNVSRLKADLQLTTCATGYAAYLFGDNTQDVDITVNASIVALDGILVTSTNSSGIKLRPTLRNCNNGSLPGLAGIRVNSSSANVEIFDPDVTDSNSRMAYGLFNELLGADVKVRGSARFTGASDTAVRATGVISEWPMETTLQGANGLFTGIANVRSSHEMMVQTSTNSASNVVLWARDLVGSRTYKVTADLVCMRGDSSDRKCVRSTVLVYQNAGIATIQGAQVDTESIASVGVAGVFSWSVSGSQILLLVNSGAVTTYRWGGRVLVTTAGL